MKEETLEQIRKYFNSQVSPSANGNSKTTAVRTDEELAG